jgi:plastocyanin
VSRRVLIAVVVLLGAAAAACGGDNKVGSEGLLNVRDQVNAQRLGQATTTIPATSTSLARLGLKPSTTAPPTTAVSETVITINSDTSGAAAQFTPNQAPAYVNQQVRWVNNDTKVRWLKFTEGVLQGQRSPDIAPGQSWATRFGSPGRLRYEDGTRPYAVGYVTVVAR